MLYNWGGRPYGKGVKQIDVAAIEVEEVLDMMITHDKDGGIVFGRNQIDGMPIYQTEGFDVLGQMQEWFSSVVPVGKTVALALMRFHLLNK